MRVAFLHSDKPREHILADAVLRGAARHGHHVEAISLANAPEPGQFDVVCMVGVKSRELFQAHHRVGAHVIYLDKGYCRGKGQSPVRGWEYWRVAIDSHQPTSRLSASYQADRWDRLGIEMQPWRKTGNHVLIAGSSAKYHAFYGMKEPTTFAKDVVRNLRAVTERPLVYRPKPSWRDAVPLLKTEFSPPSVSISEALSNAWATVTHGSNACFESVIAGIPCIVLGDAVAKPLSSIDLAELEAPRLANDAERASWANALAWFQWTAAEFASGEAWEFIAGEIHA